MRFNPIFWLHTRIGGRRAMLIGIPLGFAILVLALATVTFYLGGQRPDDRWQLVTTWAGLMTGAQALFLLLLAPSAIYRAIQRDHVNGMLQSHWITPLSNTRIVIGYLTGPPLVYVLLYLVALVLGSVFTGWLGTLSISGTRLGPLNALAGWYLGQIPLLLASLLLCSLVLLIALSTRTKTNVMALFVLVMIFGGWALVLFLPGFAIVSGITNVATFASFFVGAPVPAGKAVQALGPLLQTIFVLVFLAAACRKVRHPERPAFGVALGAAFVIACSVTLALGIELSVATMRMAGTNYDLVAPQVLASAGALVFAALVPLLAAGVSAAELDLKNARQPQAARRRLPLAFWPLLYTLLVVLVGAVMCPLAPLQAWRKAGVAPPDLVGGSLGVGLGLLGFFTTVTGWTYFLKLRDRNVAPATGVLVAILTIGPLILAGASSLAAGNFERLSDSPAMYILAFSPLGTLYVAATAPPMAVAGVAAQLLLAAAVLALTRRARRNLLQRAGFMPTAAPV